MNQLLLIDPQNDFCDIAGAALPVSGADADMRRLSGLIQTHLDKIDSITVTLDSHPSVAVERITFWQTALGGAVQPFTFITAADVRARKYGPRDAALTAGVIAMLEQLAARGRPGLVVWPVHCVTATWGHNIHSAVAEQLQAWEFDRQRVVRKVLKGEYPLSEHFGVFEADAPVLGIESTQFNTALAAALTTGTTDTDLLLLAGQASSHCVAASFDQLVSYLAKRNAPQPKIILLRDCMSPVAGFESASNAFFERARAFGAELMTANEVGALLA